MQLLSPDNLSLWFSPSAQPYMKLSSPDTSSLWFSPSALHAYFSFQVIYPLRTARLAFHSFDIHVLVSDDPGVTICCISLQPCHVSSETANTPIYSYTVRFKLVIGIDMPNVVRSLAYILSFSQSPFIYLLKFQWSPAALRRYTHWTLRPEAFLMHPPVSMELTRVFQFF